MANSSKIPTANLIETEPTLQTDKRLHSLATPVTLEGLRSVNANHLPPVEGISAGAYARDARFRRGDVISASHYVHAANKANHQFQASQEDLYYHQIRNSNNVFGASRQTDSNENGASQFKQRKLSQVPAAIQPDAEAQNVKNFNLDYQQELKDRMENVRYTFDELRQRKRERQPASELEMDEQEKFSDIQCHGKKQSITLKPFKPSSKGFILGKSRKLKRYHDSKEQNKEANQSLKYLNVDAVKQTVESYQLDDSKQSNNKSAGAPIAEEQSRRTEERKTTPHLLEPQNQDTEPFPKEHTLVDANEPLETYDETHPASLHGQFGAPFGVGVTAWSSAVGITLNVDKLPQKGKGGCKSPQVGKIRTTHRSLSTMEIQTSAGGLKFDEEIQKNESFLKFQKINQFLDKVSQAIEVRKRTTCFASRANSVQPLNPHNQELNMFSNFRSQQTLTQHKEALLNESNAQSESGNQSQILYGLNSSAAHASAASRYKTQYRPPTVDYHKKNMSEVMNLSNSVSLKKIMMNVPKSQQLTRRPKTNQMARTGQRRSLVEYQDPPAVHGEGEDRRRVPKINGFHRPTSTMVIGATTNKLVKDQKHAQLASSLFSGDKFGDQSGQDVTKNGSAGHGAANSRPGTRPGTSIVSAAELSSYQDPSLYGGKAKHTSNSIASKSINMNRRILGRADVLRKQNLLSKNQQNKKTRESAMSSKLDKNLRSSGHLGSPVDIKVNLQQSKMPIPSSTASLKAIQKAKDIKVTEKEARKVEDYMGNFLDTMKRRPPVAKIIEPTLTDENCKTADGKDDEDKTEQPDKIGKIAKNKRPIEQSKYSKQKLLLDELTGQILKQFGQNERNVIQKWLLSKAKGKPSREPEDTEQAAKGKDQRAKKEVSMKTRLSRLSALMTADLARSMRKVARRKPGESEAAEEQGAGIKTAQRWSAHSKEISERIQSEFLKQADFYIPESEDADCEHLQSFQQSGDITGVNTRLRDILEAIDTHEIKQAEDEEALWSRLGDVDDLFRKSRLQVKNLNFNLNRMLMAEGHSESIKISTDPDDQTLIGIFDKNTNTFARIEIPAKTLPVKLKLYHKIVPEDDRDTCTDGQKQYHKSLPEDLQVFISMNHREPCRRNCDLMIENFQAWNQRKQNYIMFGSESTRKQQRFPDKVFLSFVTSVKACTIGVQCSFQKSKSELFHEKRLKIIKFKGDENRSILDALEMMSPVSRERKLAQIDQQLTEYYLANQRQQGLLDAKPVKLFHNNLNVHESAVLNLRKGKAHPGRRGQRLGKLAAETLGEAGKEVVIQYERSKSESSIFDRSHESQTNTREPSIRIRPSPLALQLRLSASKSVETQYDVPSNFLSSPLMRASLSPKKSDLNKAEHQLVLNFASQLLAQRQSEASDKRRAAQSKKRHTEAEFRRHSIDYLGKWGKFRREKSQYVDQAENLLKGWVRIRQLIGLITQYRAMAQAHSAFVEHKQRIKMRIMQMFFAIKFKIRFRFNFEKIFGKDQGERFRNVIKRHLTFASQIQIRREKKVSYKILGRFLMRYGLRAMFTKHLYQYVDKLNSISQKLKPRIKERHDRATERICSVMQREIQDIINLQCKLLKKPKDFKKYQIKFKTFLEENDESHDLQWDWAGRYLGLAHLRYAADYEIFKCVRAEVIVEEIQAIESQQDYQEAMETEGAECNEVMKKGSLALEKLAKQLVALERELFEDTAIVDQEETYTNAGVREVKSAKGRGRKSRAKEGPKEPKEIYKRTTTVAAMDVAGAAQLPTQPRGDTADECRTEGNVSACQHREALMKAIVDSETGIHRKYRKELANLRLSVGQEDYKVPPAAREHSTDALCPPKGALRARATPGVARRGRRRTPQATPAAKAACIYHRFRLKIHIREIHQILFRNICELYGDM